MSRFRSVSEREVAALADQLNIDFAMGEAADAADRLNTLADIYVDLENAPTESLTERSDHGEVFETQPYRSAPSEDTHNAWITRFDLHQQDAGTVLDGIDIAVKDNMCVRGVELTCGSRAFEGFVPATHATVVRRLLDAGGRLIGKTNMDELAFGPTSETSAFGPTTNPAETTHVTGGSSSGSAAAVAAGEVDLALGTDTGGSVRIPASYCGIVGIKPTYGRVPLHGVVELAYSMDHVGTLARDVETAACGLDAIADPLPGDNAFGDDLGIDPSSLTVGVEERYFEEYVSDGVERTVRGAIDAFADMGADIVEVDIPELEYSREAWWGIAPAEFAAYATNPTGLWRHGEAERSLAAAMARVRGDSRALGANIKEMLVLGQHILATHDGYHYVRGRNLRAALRKAYDATLTEIDVIASPATPTTALEIDGFERGVTPPVNWNTHPTNLTGHPSVSVPCGETGGLPVGLQLIGARDDDTIDAAYTYEQRV
jgi:Asp-tRNA(Asn)/Glu-tRNA(Gln) amidotransferase A subunit family amidase